jgi:hypothetical protein
MAAFFNYFEIIASESVAVKVLGVDLVHHRVRTGDSMCAAEVEAYIDETYFKELDKCVKRLFAEIDAGDYATAHETYDFIRVNRKIDIPQMTKAKLNGYLEDVRKETKGKPFDFSSLKDLAEKMKLKDTLEKKFLASAQPSVVTKVIKI